MPQLVPSLGSGKSSFETEVVRACPFETGTDRGPSRENASTELEVGDIMLLFSATSTTISSDPVNDGWMLQNPNSRISHPNTAAVHRHILNCLIVTSSVNT